MTHEQGFAARCTFRFEGATALVTGAGGGMGRAVVRKFAAAGARVVASDVDEARGQETVELAREAGGEVCFARCDVSVAADVKNLVSSTAVKWGGLDYVCNAAGVSLENLELAEADEDLFDRVVAINLRGTFLCLKYEIAQMLRQGRGGAIVNISSLSAFRTRGSQQPGYVAGKAGIHGLSRIAAQRYGRDNIRVNTICPGVIDTPMLRDSLERFGTSVDEIGASYGVIGRVGSAEEIAEAVLWLCSDSSSYVVGSILPVDGGELTR